MGLPDSSSGSASPLEWKTYSVQRREKAALLEFIIGGLAMRGCQIVTTSDPRRAPFYIVFETPAGERHGILAYAFRAGARVTNKRPTDEHRFQVKYGSELKGVLEVAVDPCAVITTIFLGIDLERRVFVAADPLMNTPSPMSRSIEFKKHHVEDILRHCWWAWERDRRQPRTRDRPTPDIDEDTRIQVLVGGKQDRIYDLITLERLAIGLDPGERHLLADKLAAPPNKTGVVSASHRLLKELDVGPDALFELIDGAARLKMAVRGWVAEQHLEDTLSVISGVSDCRRLNLEGRPDLTLRWKDSPPILIECKNVLRSTDAAGQPRVDFQRTRAAKSNPCSRYYMPSDFNLLAACLHSVTEKWEFKYAVTRELPEHKRCQGRINNNLKVSDDLFTSDVRSALDRCVS
jgi:hypothetical protein